MTFRVRIEREIIGGKKVIDEFENVSSLNNPPMVPKIKLEFADDREEKPIVGDIVLVDDEPPDSQTE